MIRGQRVDKIVKNEENIHEGVRFTMKDVLKRIEAGEGAETEEVL